MRGSAARTDVAPPPASGDADAVPDYFFAGSAGAASTAAWDPGTQTQTIVPLIVAEDFESGTLQVSQLPPGQWHDYLGEPTLADAICDRLLHNAHRLVLKGPSRRNPKEEKSDH